MKDSKVSMWFTDDLSHSEYARAMHRTFAFEPHFHSTSCLALIVKGTLRLTLGRTQQDVPSGSFVFINAGDVHAGHATSPEGYAMRTLHAAPADLAALLGAATPDGRGGLSMPSGVYDSRKLTDTFFGIHVCAQTGDNRLKRDEYLLRLMRLLSDRGVTAAGASDTQPTGGSTAASRMRDYIEHHLCEPIRLAKLSDLVAMPPYAAVRTFKKQYGLPPHRYQTQRRVDMARKLIRGGTPIADLSYLCGFADQPHFTRAFKKVLGVTPGFYARQVA
jgi:AraC-like DNA-binding protein